MIVTSQEAIDQARSFGLQDREAYRKEFGGEPVDGEIGDWDSTGWGEAWDGLAAKFEVKEDDQEAYDELKAAYLSALFATNDDV